MICTHHQAGSFGVREDDVFLAASRLARETGVPRLYWGMHTCTPLKRDIYNAYIPFELARCD